MNPPHASRRDRVFQATWQDGSIDLAAGLAVVAIALFWFADLFAFAPIAPALAVPLWMAFRQVVVEPRLGRVTFDAARRRRTRRGHVVLLAVGVAVFLVAVLLYLGVTRDGSDELLRSLVPALPAALLGLGAGLAALLFGMGRLALYGAGFVVAGLAVAALGLEPGWALLAGGLVPTLVGTALLARFLRDFPRLSGDLD